MFSVKRLPSFLLILWLATLSLEAQVSHLRLEYRDNPQGMDALYPRFSWIITSTHRGER